MKIIINVIFLYILLIASMIVFYISLSSTSNHQLNSTQNRLTGIKYLCVLHKLSIDIGWHYGYIKLKDDIKKERTRRKSMNTHIQEIYSLQKKYPRFINKSFNDYLKLIENSKMEYDDYFQFFDYINDDSYIIGKKSELLFSEDRERYFLGTLLTHYVPEFFISVSISHNILEEFLQDPNISSYKKSIYIEQHKLSNLSGTEIAGIINLLDGYPSKDKLQIIMDKINIVLKKQVMIRGKNTILHHKTEDIQNYLEETHKLLDLAEELNTINTKILKQLLIDNKARIEGDIKFYRNILILMFIFSSIIFGYLLYIFGLYLKQDKKLETLNRTLIQKVKKEVDKNRRKDQKMIEQSRLAQMGEMISMIAHQWRQPLTAISATSSGLFIKAKLGKITPETVIENSQNISNYAQHLSDTIDEFRDFFKPNKQKTDSSFNEIVKSVMGIVKSSIANKNIKIIKEMECDDRFLSYSNEIKQVVLNLIKNAEDALIDNHIKEPYIKIRTFKENNHLILTVSDNARGIPQEILTKIFDPYFSTKKAKNGTGLGLYMSKTIIEEHCQGLLTVSNDKYGATFRITI